MFLSLEAPAGLEDELAGLMAALGSAGSWSEPADAGRSRLHVVFAAGLEPDGGELRRRLAGFPGVTVSAARPLEDRDWQAAWRESASPIPVGARFLVDPGEPADVVEPVDAGGRILLRLPARTAFGVGSHESTRLALELLEATPLAGRRVLDVGTGTGILAFAALHLGAHEVVACDLDPAAALLLPQTMALNGRRFHAYAGTLDALSFPKTETRTKSKTEAAIAGKGKDGELGSGGDGDLRFDVAVVNVIPEEIAPDLDRLAAALRPGGTALFSGILSERLEDAIARVGRHGLRHPPHARRQAGARDGAPAVVEAGEWAAFAAERVR